MAIGNGNSCKSVFQNTRGGNSKNEIRYRNRRRSEAYREELVRKEVKRAQRKRRSDGLSETDQNSIIKIIIWKCFIRHGKSRMKLN